MHVLPYQPVSNPELEKSGFLFPSKCVVLPYYPQTTMNYEDEYPEEIDPQRLWEV
jgi:hypothetical protein